MSYLHIVRRVRDGPSRQLGVIVDTLAHAIPLSTALVAVGVLLRPFIRIVLGQWLLRAFGVPAKVRREVLVEQVRTQLK